MPIIREFQEADWPRIWPILHEVFESGESYPQPPGTTEEEARRYWLEEPAASFVAVEDDGTISGTYYIKPNQPGLGSHVCNCGYMVAKDHRGKGVACAMCEHSQEKAVEMGFRAMQYNLVVATNEASVRLWRKMDFEEVGTLPGAFRHKRLGYVDAYVMYKELV